jgi:hypothetical protein
LAAGEEAKLTKPLTVVQSLLANEAAEPSLRTAAEALLLTLSAAAPLRADLMDADGSPRVVGSRGVYSQPRV